MSYKTVTESITQEKDENLIFKTKNQFIPNTVTATTSNGVTVSLKEMGKNIVKIGEPVSKGTIIVFSYSIEIAASMPDEDIFKEMQKIRDKLASLEESQEILMATLQERVPLKTFNQWLSVMEKNFGKTILQNIDLMGIQGESPVRGKRG